MLGAGRVEGKKAELQCNRSTLVRNYRHHITAIMRLGMYFLNQIKEGVGIRAEDLEGLAGFELIQGLLGLDDW